MEYCRNCGNKLIEGAKFCGKCGRESIQVDATRSQTSFQKRLDKHLSQKKLARAGAQINTFVKKKSSNADEAVLLLGFLLSLSSSINDNFGFVSMSDAQSIGRNMVPLAWIILFAVSAMRIIIKARKKDTEVVSTDSKSSKKFTRDAVLKVVIMLAVILSVGGYHYAHQQNVTGIFQDALYGTNKGNNAEMSKMMADMLAYMKAEGIKRNPNTVAIDGMAVLEFNSFKTRQSLLSVINTLKGSIDELGRANETQSLIREGARGIIKNSNLSDTDKMDVLTGFNKSAGDTQQASLTQKRNSAMKATYEEILRLYNFLYENFDDYVISLDKDGNQNITFYSDKNIDTYNQYSEQIQSLSSIFASADKEWRDYGSAKLKNRGINMSADEIINAVQ